MKIAPANGTRRSEISSMTAPRRPRQQAASRTAALTSASVSGPKVSSRTIPTRSPRTPSASVRAYSGTGARLESGSFASYPAIACRSHATSSTVRASGPGVSIDQLSGNEPCRDTRLQVGRSPTTPQNDAGERTEPPVASPSDAAQSPAATATPDPDDEPPGS